MEEMIGIDSFIFIRDCQGIILLVPYDLDAAIHEPICLPYGHAGERHKRKSNFLF